MAEECPGPAARPRSALRLVDFQLDYLPPPPVGE